MPHTLRYYERTGLIQPVIRNKGNQRRYQPDDVRWLQFLRQLRETGMPIAQIREYATLRIQGEPTLQARLTLLIEHQQQLRQEIKQLRQHEHALTNKIEACQKISTGTDTAESVGVQDEDRRR